MVMGLPGTYDPATCAPQPSRFTDGAFTSVLMMRGAIDAILVIGVWRAPVHRE